jgi:hypothetical protein
MTTRRLAAAAVGILVMLSACGIPEDGEPEVIAQDQLPALLQGSGPDGVATTVATGVGESIFVIETDPDSEEKRLSPLEVIFNGAPTPELMIRSLLFERELSSSLSNAIPTNVRLDAPVEIDGDLATITLSEEFADVQGETLQLAVAQLVYTATELGTVDRVRFRVADELIDVPAENTLKGVVTRGDYEEFAPRED